MKSSDESDRKSSGFPQPNPFDVSRGRGAFAGSAEEQPARHDALTGTVGASLPSRHSIDELGGNGWARNCEGGSTWHYFAEGLSLCGKRILHRRGLRDEFLAQLTLFPGALGELEPVSTADDCGTCGRVLELRRRNLEAPELHHQVDDGDQKTYNPRVLER